MLNSNDNQPNPLSTLDQLVPEPMIESCYDCPVCLGLPMEKLKFALSSGRSFTLDGCKRCEGIWFDAEEMRLAAALDCSQLSGDPDSSVRLAPKPMTCHGCGDLMSRNFHQCPSCAWKNVINCPVCETAMERRSVNNLVIDICSSCDGTWLDRVELRSIAQIAKHQEFKHSAMDPFEFTPSTFTPSTVNHSSSSSGFSESGVSNAVDGAQVGFEILSHTPEAGEAIVEAAAGLVEVLGAGLEAVPEVAGAVVEGIAALLGALFSGL